MDIPDYDNIGLGHATIQFIVWQLEKVETLHIQAALYTNKAMTYANLVKKLGEFGRRCHVEEARSANAIYDYCRKPDSRVSPTYYEKGIAPATGSSGTTMGARMDLVRLRQALDSHGLVQAWNEHFPVMLKYHKGAESYTQLTGVAQPRPNMKTICIYGPPGTGKSLMVQDILEILLPGKAAYYKAIGPWWDMYARQPVIVWDDFDGKGTPIREVKNICDVYPCTVQIKGKCASLCNEVVLITTNTHPRDWYPESADIDRKAVLRRLNIINLDNVHMTTQQRAFETICRLFTTDQDRLKAMLTQQWLNIINRARVRHNLPAYNTADDVKLDDVNGADPADAANADIEQFGLDNEGEFRTRSGPLPAAVVRSPGDARATPRTPIGQVRTRDLTECPELPRPAKRRKFNLEEEDTESEDEQTDN